MKNASSENPVELFVDLLGKTGNHMEDRSEMKDMPRCTDVPSLTTTTQTHDEIIDTGRRRQLAEYT